MNVPETTQILPTPQAPFKGAWSTNTPFDNSTMDFLEMFQALARQSGVTNTNQYDLSGGVTVSVLDDEETTDPTTIEKEATPTLKKTKGLLPLKGLAMAKIDGPSDAFQLDLSNQDLNFLQQWLVQALPHPNGIFIQQLVPLDNHGAPQFGTSGISGDLSELIKKAYQSGRSLRVELTKDSTVIFKFTGGQVSAEFLSKDPAMALYMKQYLAMFRQQLLDKDLPVGELAYRDKHPQQEKQSDSSSQEDKQPAAQ